ncbi:hypothetical protein H310_04317 [Aphanomyces invadans]|uniref:Uncharacterized protein n=1 Tax=Aphanomyces invadans TaxID=157072 RepID=A0A024UDG2_9STRA|nr:hypothetical protein H310_04317 [Aphanomyces invadans]ETW03892.1 hypothetical protein H310_04317 [Aphanomyces invadans]|eukprot:XP_008866848.1 hypothetical protein H310_04317 [Aphanomyces invadans]
MAHTLAVARTGRTAREVLRCFPHCCPTHSHGKFCTTSIDLKLTDVDSPVPNVLAFARFQEATTRVFQAGDVVDASFIVGSCRTTQNPKGEWIPSHSSYHNEAKREMVFQLHHEPGGWHYGWVGSANQVHRACLHRFVVPTTCSWSPLKRHRQGYVVEWHDSTKLRVVVSTASPPFIIMSYRRACYACQKHRPQKDGKPSDAVLECVCDGAFNLDRSTASSEGTVVVGPAGRSDRITDDSLDDVAAIERHLRVFMAFISVPSIHFFSAQLPTLDDCIRSGLVHPMVAAHDLRTDDLPPLHVPLSIVRPDVAAPLVADANLESLKALCVDVALSTVTFAAFKLNAKLFSDNAERLLDRDALYDAYVEWIELCHHAMADRLQRFNTSLAQLTDAIIHATTTHHDEWKPLSTSITALLDDPRGSTTPEFDYFVAQLREVYMAENHPPLRSAFPSSKSPFDGRWMYYTTTSVVYAATTSPELDFSLATFLRCVTMGYSFQLRVVGHVVQMRSDLSLFDTVWAEFILDSTARVFRVFPNGESSMARLSGHLHGDYIGRVVNTDVREICMDLFSWPLDGCTTIHRITVKLQPTHHPFELAVSFAVGVATSVAGDTPDYSVLSASDRYTSYVAHDETAIANVQALYRLCT